jgi:hypothetical protein
MNGLLIRFRTWLSTAADGQACDQGAPVAELPSVLDPEYVLRGWPDLPEDLRHARVYQLLSILSVGPCGRSRLLGRTTLAQCDFDRLLQRLLDEKVVQIRTTHAQALVPGA